MRSTSAGCGCVLALALAFLFLAPSASGANITIGTFGLTVTDAIAKQLGLWADQGLEPVFLTVPGSIAAYDELAKGTYDVLTASIDNTIGRYLGGIDSARVLGGVTTGAGLALWARPEIKSPKDLLGKKIAVDAPTSGYAYVLYKILAYYGLRPYQDYSILPIGGARTAALQTGQVDATIFGSPQTEIQLTNNTQNLTLLAYIPELFPGYQGSTYNVRPEVVKNKTTDLYQRVVKYLAVQLQARQILALSKDKPKAKDAVVQAIITELKLSPAVAELVWQGAVGPNGFLANPNLTITDQQMLAVASIRQQFNGLLGYAPLYQDLSGILLGGPLQDYSVRDEALALIAQNPGQNYNARVAQYKA